ncbi:MAG: DUF2971 domain-containing protein [Mucilaginibacter sp.]|uniref:DUF2971 domain-containing protein n=1 Tax=Mucilaginibacter sp. TaxID=1882438 RepID=UPI0032669D34
MGTAVDSPDKLTRQGWFMQEFLPDGLPQKFYKFSAINPNLHISLKDGYLWHSRPSTFNDPFDCYKHLLKFEPTENDVIEFCTRNYTTGEIPLEKQIAYLVQNPHKLADAQWKSMDDTINGQGICCFTENFQNTLMWSHYAANHSGLCLVFNPYMDISLFVVKVRYTDDFVPRNYYENNRVGALVMLSTKSNDWAYEQEYRSISATPGTNAFKKEMLTEVIFGCKTTQEEIFAIMNTIENAGYKNVEYTRAFTETNSFKLGFKPLLPF